jgi:hypothetical protein
MSISLFVFSVSELYVDIPESGVAERIPVHLDVSVLEIPCQCKRKTKPSIHFLEIIF